MITIKEYKRVESLEEAWQLNQKKSNAIIGGMLWLKMGRGNVQTAIDLSALDLDTIEETEEEFRIGAMVTLRDLEMHEGMNTYSDGAVKEALHSIVGVQFRNVATIGGSVYGRYGFSDVLTMLMAMDSYVELYKGGIISLAEYAKQKYDRDVLVRIIIKKEQAHFHYQSVRNTKTDFPVLTCAAVKKADGTYAFAIGARPQKAALLVDEKQILRCNEDGTLDESTVKSFTQYAGEQLVTGSNTRGTAEYRSHLIEVLVKRAIQALR